MLCGWGGGRSNSFLANILTPASPLQNSCSATLHIEIYVSLSIPADLSWNKIGSCGLVHSARLCKSRKASLPTQPLRFGCEVCSLWSPSLPLLLGFLRVTCWLLCAAAFPILGFMVFLLCVGKTLHSRKLPLRESAGWLGGEV